MSHGHCRTGQRHRHFSGAWRVRTFRGMGFPWLLWLLLAAVPTYGPELEGFDYAFPVGRVDFSSQREPLHMSYLDVAPARPAGRTVVLLHGKNFCAGTWESTIRALVQAGFRVVAPDQIGFCKSSKPERYQYSFQQL